MLYKIRQTTIILSSVENTLHNILSCMKYKTNKILYTFNYQYIFFNFTLRPAYSNGIQIYKNHSYTRIFIV